MSYSPGASNEDQSEVVAVESRNSVFGRISDGLKELVERLKNFLGMVADWIRMRILHRY